MINGIAINKNQLGRKPIGRIVETKEDLISNEYSNIVIGYIGGSEPVLIKTNLSQSEWDRVCNGKLSCEEIHNII